MYINDFKTNAIVKLQEVYIDKNEIQNIIELLLLKIIVHYNKFENLKLDDFQIKKLEKDIDELCTHKPIQYVLEEAWFYKFPFYVNEHTLIPRPETEELVFLCVQYIKANNVKSILDIGTGSGCIAISIKKECPNLTVFGIDKSIDALAVAKKNAIQLEADVTFIYFDLLQDDMASLPEVEFIVSNPPYISYKEKNDMQNNVVAYEPHMALFVKDDDPLLFYKKIASLGKPKKLPLFLEISEFQGESTKELFTDSYPQVKLIKDMQGKDRIVVALP